MNRSTRRKIGDEVIEFRDGDRYKVVKAGAKLRNIHVTLPRKCWTYTTVMIPTGSILTCSGPLHSGGSDGVDLVGWHLPKRLREKAQAEVDAREAKYGGGYVDAHGEFSPTVGSMWSRCPDMQYLRRVEGRKGQ